MAGQEIYLGKMIESLQTDIGTVVTTLQTHTTALGNINNAVAQSVSEINVKVGTDKTSVLSNALFEGNTTRKYITLYSGANGKATLKGKWKSKNGTGVNGFIDVSYDNGATWIQIHGPVVVAASLIDIAAVMDVIKGVMLIGVRSDNASFYAQIQAGMTIEYSLKDIVNEGAFA